MKSPTPQHSRQPTTRVLGAADIALLVRLRGLDAVMIELIDRMRDTIAAYDPQRCIAPVRAGFQYQEPASGLIEWMPVMDLGRIVSVKTVGYHPSNPLTRAIPSVIATTSLYDPATGRLSAILDATLLTALRTGAAAAVATDVLAVEGPVVVGVLGCGAQAVSQLHAIDKVRHIERVLAFDVDGDAAASFARRLQFLDRPVKTVSAAERELLLTETDVLVTATTVEVGGGPVIADGAHRPWLHVNAIGSDFPGKQELPSALLRRAIICPDVPEQCRAEGEAQWVPGQTLGPDLAALVQQASDFVSLREQLTVFDSTGWSLEDMVVAEMMLDHAAALGIGTSVELQATGGDPRDPYAMLDV
jgi:L-lysine cyclodeaminase